MVGDASPSDAARAELRGKVLRWLREELEALRQTSHAKTVTQSWLGDGDLVVVRDAAHAKGLSGSERDAWSAFWSTVRAAATRWFGGL